MRLTNQEIVAVAASSGLSVATVRRVLSGTGQPFALTQHAMLKALRKLGHEGEAKKLKAAWRTVAGVRSNVGRS